MKKKPAPHKPVKGTWRPPSLARLWTIQIQLQEEIKKLATTVQEVAKKANDHGNEIYALQHPIAPGSDRVVSNEAMTLVQGQESTRPSSMEIVQKRVCFINGHRIGILERQVPNTELPDPSKAFHRTTVLKQEILCLACGMLLEEIRAAK